MKRRTLSRVLLPQLRVCPMAIAEFWISTEWACRHRITMSHESRPNFCRAVHYGNTHQAEIVMNKILIAVLAAVSFASLNPAASESSSTNLAARIRTALAELYRNEDPRSLSAENLMDSFELRFAPAHYLPLVEIMSNNWQTVLSELDAYATNKAERLLLINTGWWCGDAEYLGFSSVLADSVLTGRLDRAEFSSFYLNSVNSHHGARIFEFRHGEQEVSNIIEKVRQCVSVGSNYWDKVFSGAAMRETLDMEADGAL